MRSDGYAYYWSQADSKLYLNIPSQNIPVDNTPVLGFGVRSDGYGYYWESGTRILYLNTPGFSVAVDNNPVAGFGMRSDGAAYFWDATTKLLQVNTPAANYQVTGSAVQGFGMRADGTAYFWDGSNNYLYLNAATGGGAGVNISVSATATAAFTADSDGVGYYVPVNTTTLHRNTAATDTLLTTAYAPGTLRNAGPGPVSAVSYGTLRNGVRRTTPSRSPLPLNPRGPAAQRRPAPDPARFDPRLWVRTCGQDGHVRKREQAADVVTSAGRHRCRSPQPGFAPAPPGDPRRCTGRLDVCNPLRYRSGWRASSATATRPPCLRGSTSPNGPSGAADERGAAVDIGCADPPAPDRIRSRDTPPSAAGPLPPPSWPPPRPAGRGRPARRRAGPDRQQPRAGRGRAGGVLRPAAARARRPHLHARPAHDRRPAGQAVRHAGRAAGAGLPARPRAGAAGPVPGAVLRRAAADRRPPEHARRSGPRSTPRGPRWSACPTASARPSRPSRRVAKRLQPTFAPAAGTAAWTSWTGGGRRPPRRSPPS